MHGGELVVLDTPAEFRRSQQPEALAFLECLRTLETFSKDSL